MNNEHLPLILIEIVLIGGGVALFGWWQLRSVRFDREKAAADRAAKAAAQTAAAVPRVPDQATEPASQAKPPPSA